jgi:hypothetical protein
MAKSLRFVTEEGGLGGSWLLIFGTGVGAPAEEGNVAAIALG